MCIYFLSFGGGGGGGTGLFYVCGWERPSLLGGFILEPWDDNIRRDRLTGLGWTGLDDWTDRDWALEFGFF